MLAEVGLLTAWQELWVHLHSANSSQSHIPQQILDQKAEELRKRKEISDQINVSAHANSSLHRSRGITPGQLAFL